MLFFPSAFFLLLLMTDNKRQMIQGPLLRSDHIIYTIVNRMISTGTDWQAAGLPSRLQQLCIQYEICLRIHAGLLLVNHRSPAALFIIVLFLPIYDLFYHPTFIIGFRLPTIITRTRQHTTVVHHHFFFLSSSFAVLKSLISAAQSSLFLTLTSLVVLHNPPHHLLWWTEQERHPPARPQQSSSMARRDVRIQ